MKRIVVLCCACFVSGILLIGCEREQGVRAGEESTETYQPRTAPAEAPGAATQEIRGQLTRVDMAGKTIAVRAENGMEQTFKFDDRTMVMGLPGAPGKPAETANTVRDLAGKEGSEISIQWRDEAGTKIASHVNVIEVSPTKGSKGPKR